MGELLIRVIKRFHDLQHGYKLRIVGATFQEKKERAEELIQKGYAELIEEARPPIKIETAVKKEEPEKAIIKTEKEPAKKPTKELTKKKPTRKKTNDDAKK